ncbi:hypothetical protein KP509_18G082800 [Ceratopteris richardii]|uniref:Mitochondrial substrate carrier family protein n=1 Tax=Ceratopteris richardii TaxID=49495 RepID=A0A8T2SV67_CERRI|nr:hypothetical protein KP509_18G082800 [Ceratopteris richardii]
MSMCFPAENLAFKSSAMNGGEILLSEKHRDGHAQRQENTANGPLIKALWVSSKALNGMPTPEDLSMPISGSTGHQNGVRFRWLKTGIMEENSVDVIRGIRHYKEPALDLPAVFVEDVSRRPGDKSLKGWANIKYTMDYVLGRSIVPTAKHKFSKTSYSAGKDVSLLQKAVSQRHVVNNSNCLASRSTGEQIENSPQIQNDQLLSSDDKSRSIAKHKLSKTSRSAGKDVSFSQKAASQTYGIKNSNGLASLSANKQFENSPQIQNDQLHSPDDNSRSKAKDKLNKRSCSAGKDLSCSQKAVSQGHGIKNSNCLESLSASKQIENSPQIQNDQLPSSDIKSKSIAKQFLFVRRDAAAGAFAGICVSLCLHPIDTVKTVIQSQSIGSRSVFRTVLAIISDRGFSGLYRGLGSNLASSGPISAIYTFTYESVKAALLPHLPREYHAIAHCTAGGCASIATSVVYTPSECVKQRMQVGCFQRNSWLTFLAILRNEGPSVLYSVLYI